MFMQVPAGTYPVCEEMFMVAEEAERRLPEDGQLLDLGCGVGTIAIQVASDCPDVNVLGVDINSTAVWAAKVNARPLSNAWFRLSDVYEKVPNRFDVITCTLPWEDESAYDEQPEPKEAFITQDMGLARALEGAKRHLVPGGYFVMWGPANIGKKVFPMVGLTVERYVFNEAEDCVVVGHA
jgi:release factor glutamine methyltransferase